MKINDLRGKTLVLAASGGLDSCTATKWMTDHGVTVISCTAHLAQPDEANIEIIKSRMLTAGAKEAILTDAREELAEAGLQVIQSQACYEGRYWNTTGIARYVTTKAIIKEMRARNVTILSHGATGRGNDQVRFQLAANMLAPDIKVYAPWRDPEFLSAFGGRSQMIDYCEKHKLPVTAKRDAPYSTDANVLGLTHEAGKLESLHTPASFIKAEMGVHHFDAPDKAESVEITFRGGRPVAIDGKHLSLLDCFLTANERAGKHGVGIATHLVENRFVGIKSRGIYEAPGMELLGTAYGLLLELVLDRRARELYDVLSKYIAKQIYQGYWFDLGTQMALRGIERSADLISGKMKLSMHKGGLHFESADSVPHSLYSEENASMEAMGTYDHGDSEGLLNVLGVSARMLAKAGHIKEKV